jgi:hypothetical protein
MDIKIKETGTYYGKSKIFHLLVDGKKYGSDFYLEDNGNYSPDCLDEELISPFLKLNCIDLPENIELSYSFDSPPLCKLDHCETSGIDFFRKGNNFTMYISIYFPEDTKLNSYFNPSVMVKYVAAVCAKNGLLKCRNINQLEAWAGFTYVSKAEGTIDFKIKHAKSLINAAFDEAIKEMHLEGRKLRLG